MDGCWAVENCVCACLVFVRDRTVISLPSSSASVMDVHSTTSYSLHMIPGKSTGRDATRRDGMGWLAFNRHIWHPDRQDRPISWMWIQISGRAGWVDEKSQVEKKTGGGLNGGFGLSEFQVCVYG